MHAFISPRLFPRPSHRAIAPLCTARPSATNRSIARSTTSHRPAWRPSLDDVERISRGQPARTRGTGSRAVPHRLNRDEREAYNRAQRNGFLEIFDNLAHRRERKGAPLFNIWRQWCDAQARPAVFLIKSAEGTDDVVMIDVSTLRKERFHLFGSEDGVEETLYAAFESIAGKQGELEVENDDVVTQQDWETMPVWRLPMSCLKFSSAERGDAKQCARVLGEYCVKAITAAGQHNLAATAMSEQEKRTKDKLRKKKARRKARDFRKDENDY